LISNEVYGSDNFNDKYQSYNEKQKWQKYRYLENIVLWIAKLVEIDKTGDQNCCELRVKELESNIPIKKFVHSQR
jgi:hypothetical protein